MKDPQGREISQAVSMMFMTDANANIIGFVASDAFGPKPVPLTEASLVSGKFAVKIGSLGADYRADLSGNTLKGEWVQGAQRVPLTFTKR